jgi:hypothetical protein
MTTFRAAFYKMTVLTGPEHASLSDEDLRAEALAEAQRGDIIDMEEADPEVAYPRVTRAQFESGLQIGEWKE